MISPVVQDLIGALLEPDPRRRMGSEGGCAQLRDEAALVGFDWEQLADATLESPLAKRVASVIRAGGGGAASEEVAPPEFAKAKSEWASRDF